MLGVTGQGWFVYNNASLGWIIALMQKYQTVAKHIPEECPYRKVICEYCSQQIQLIKFRLGVTSRKTYVG
jgi:hypothetical protein